MKRFLSPSIALHIVRRLSHYSGAAIVSAGGNTSLFPHTPVVIPRFPHR